MTFLNCSTVTEPSPASKSVSFARIFCSPCSSLTIIQLRCQILLLSSYSLIGLAFPINFFIFLINSFAEKLYSPVGQTVSKRQITTVSICSSCNKNGSPLNKFIMSVIVNSFISLLFMSVQKFSKLQFWAINLQIKVSLISLSYSLSPYAYFPYLSLSALYKIYSSQS